MGNRTRLVLVAASVLLLSLLTGCKILDKLNIDYVETDREYYKTHTEEEGAESNFHMWEDPTGETADAADTANAEAGVIENCALRTGVETSAYADASTGTEKLKIPANMTFQILQTDNGFFQIDYDGTKLWIPVKNCLINAKQYIPALEVDLGLSHSPNYFNIGGNKIKGLTEKQLYTRDGSVDGSEAWLRYETAVKLLEAEKLFEEDNYRIKLVDAYRPYSVTIAIRDGLNEFLNTSDGQNLKNQYFGGYSVNAFLAQGTSAHNYGVAVDMTLVDNESGNALSMPAAMHTLDASSAYDTWRDDSSVESIHGDYMRGKMKDCGFSPLDSEWWHFQLDTVERIQFDIPN